MPSSRTVEDSPEYRGFLDAIVGSGSDPTDRLVFADWLDEQNRSQEAELMRLHVALLATCCEPDKHPERVQQQARIVELLAAGVRPCLPQHTIALAEGVDMTFAWIPPGTFLMGSPPEEQERDEDEAQHRVTLAQGFYLGIHAVTQAQWQAVMGDNPSHFKGEDLPVEMVSWDDCQSFCARLSQKDGNRFCLPTEAEWEYACRAGTTMPFHFGEMIDTDQVNYNGDYPYAWGQKGVFQRRTTAVCSFPPNALGLFDLHGNVWEWCQNEYRLPEGAQTEDLIDIENIEENARVLRGGSWCNDAGTCRAASRLWNGPGTRNCNGGFRVAFRLD